MNYSNYIYINTDYLIENITNLKKYYPYTYYILDVSNNAFIHGMYSILSIENKIDYLYVHNFNDVLYIRKYNQEIPIIYDGDILENNFFDLVLNNVILTIKDIKTFQYILSIKDKDNIELLLEIDSKGYNGFSKKEDIRNIIEALENKKHLHILGIKSNILEKDYYDFTSLISPLKDLKLKILNSELDMHKIKGSNAILLDSSIYGISNKKKPLKKDQITLKQAFTLYSKIINIVSISKKKKTIYEGIIPFGYKNGMNPEIKKVYIHNKLYNIKEIKDDITIISLDNTISIGEIVEITSENNKIANYKIKHPLYSLGQFNSNVPYIYKDYVIEKTFVF